MFGKFFDDSGDTFFEAVQAFAVQANGFLESAFESSNIDESWWAGVVGTADTPGMLSIWMPVMAVVIAILVMIQVVFAAWRGSGVGMVRAVAGALLAIPGTYAMVILVQGLSLVSDQVTSYILERGGAENANVFMKIFGVQISNGELIGVNSKYEVWASVGEKSGGLAMIAPLLLMFIMWLMSIVLGIVMALRSMVIVLLSSFAGWALASLSADITKSWFAGFMKLMVGLLLAKPFAASTIVLSATVFNFSDSGSQLFAGLAGLFIAICMPFAAVAFVNFTPAGSITAQDQAMGSGPSSAARFASRGVQTISRFRRR